MTDPAQAVSASLLGGGVSLSPLALAGVAAVGLISGVINTLAGAGSLITLPALIFLGLPATVANATNRVGVVLQSAAATATFSRKGVLRPTEGLRLLAPAAVGAAIGAQVSSILDPRSMERVIAVAMLLMLALVLRPPPKTDPRPVAAPIRGLVFLGVGFYGGFLQVGVGLFLIAALQATAGMDLIRSNAMKSFLVLGFTLVALAIFGVHGLIDVPVAVVLAAGSALGGWLGGHLALRGGERLIKVVLTAVVLASSARLLGLW